MPQSFQIILIFPFLDYCCTILTDLIGQAGL